MVTRVIKDLYKGRKFYTQNKQQLFYYFILFIILIIGALLTALCMLDMYYDTKVDNQKCGKFLMARNPIAPNAAFGLSKV